METPRSMRFALPAAALLAALAMAGCSEVYRKPLPTGAVENPLKVDSQYDPLFAAVLATLRDHRFQIYRQDIRRGEIVTQPLTGQQMWEFWRSDAAGLYNQLESSVHTLLRSVQVHIYPVRDEAGQEVPDQYFLDMRVATERLSVPEADITAANQLPSAYSPNVGLINMAELSHDRATEARRVFLGRDTQLEDWLIRDVLRRVYREPRGADKQE